ncbi:MAG: hypothetical protein FJX75_11615 [Armatimonadetes bacterium]|nr:hypothetical protein [Armatimonadota bacterium]
MPALPATALLLGLLVSAAHAAVTVGPDQSITSEAVRVAPLMEDGRCTGFAVTAGDKPVAQVRLGPRGAITAAKAEARKEGAAAILRLTGLSVAANAAKLTEDSAVTVQLAEDAPWPRVAFSLGIETFDEAAWQKLVGGTLPFHFLVCDVPQATMFYQGGGMIPLPEVDPFPFTATGFMAGEWAEGWSYAPAMAAWAVPAVGLWNHHAQTFVAYDFNEQRQTDRSGELVASAGCLGDGGPPFFCLVHPYQKLWVKLTYPPVPSRVASHFELIYSFDLPDSRDPNQFVLERLWREKRSLLPPVPRTNDLAWIPEYDGFAPNGGIEPTAVGTGLVWTSGPTGLEGAFVELGAKMLGNDFISDGILRAETLRPGDPGERLHQDLAYLMERCTWVEVDGDRCATWVHPIEGKFQDRWGGERCAGNHHPSTFQIGAAMLRLYQQTKDPQLLPYIDGVYNWCKHYLFTRNGVCDLPWAMFSREATAVGENFLLTYRQVFRDDPERKGNADEALALARTAVYKNLWFYTADPDPTDDLDPTFLNQATNDCRWAGRVTWNEAGWVLRTMVPVYCETGDPFLKYLLRGSIERYYAGFREDGGIAENLQIFGEIEAKGLRTGGFADAEHGGLVRRWARPLDPAKLRVAMGQRAAIAFCMGTRAYDIAEYGYAPETNFTFRLVSLPGAPRDEAIDLVATAPFRDLRGQTVAVNGQALPAERYEFNDATAGEDVFIRGVKPGDVVSIGEAARGQATEEDGIPYRDGPPRVAAPWWPVNLRSACNTSLKRDWWQEDSWFGLTPGRREVWRIPVHLVDPEDSRGRDAVTKGEAKVGMHAGALFAVVGRLRGQAQETPHVARLSIAVQGAAPRTVDIDWDIPFDLTNGFPLRKFDTYLAAVDLGGSPMVLTVTVEDGTLLALTLGDRESPDVRAALQQAGATRSATLAARAQRYYQAPAAQCPHDRPWAPEMRQPWRFRLTALPATTERVDAVLSAREDFAQLLLQVGLEGTVAPASLQAFEVTKGREPAAAPVQFDPLPGENSQRGELLLLMRGVTAAGEERSFDVYCGPEPVATKTGVSLEVTDDRVVANIGEGGLRFEFALDAANGHPRWTGLAFWLDRDGNLGENVLGRSGYNGGLADLTCCTDWMTWYDCGGLQTRPARAEVLNAGPVATTVRVSGIELWGQGDTVKLGTRENGETYGASPAGEADWYFRFYDGKPVVEQWVDYRVTSLSHGWTRPLQVRYGLDDWQASGLRTVAGQPVAFGGGLAVTPLAGGSTTFAPQCMFTDDGHVLQVAFNRPDALGSYFTGRWMCFSASLSDSAILSVASGAAVEQSSIETLVGGQIVKRAPQPLPLVEFDRTGGQGPGPRPQIREVVTSEGNLNPDPSLERQEAFWALGSGDMEARWTTTQVYSGRVAIDLSCTEKSLSLVSTNGRASHALNLAPNAVYEVTYWAKCTSGDGEVHTNFYSTEPGCDFRHVISPVPTDGEWHQIQAEVTTGDFPARDQQTGVFARNRGVAPALRLWTYRKAQTTYVDQVEVKRLR